MIALWENQTSMRSRVAPPKPASTLTARNAATIPHHIFYPLHGPGVLSGGGVEYRHSGRRRSARDRPATGGDLMKLLRLFAAACAVAALTGVAYLAREQAPLGSQMADAAEKFLDTLAADQRTKAVLAFDDKDRTNWQFVPLQDKDK